MSEAWPKHQTPRLAAVCTGAGLSVCDDGLVIDLSRMRGVRVDPASRTALVLGGAAVGALWKLAG